MSYSHVTELRVPLSCINSNGKYLPMCDVQQNQNATSALLDDI